MEKSSAGRVRTSKASGQGVGSPFRRLLEGSRQLDRTSDDRRLITACLQGKERAWEALIEKYKNLIYSIPIKYGASRDDAADIFQAVCLELFTELPRVRNIDTLRPWLMTVTAHQAFHWKRSRLRQSRREVEGMDEDRLSQITLPPAIAAEVEREQMVREAIARLPPRCRELVRMLFYEQPARPYAEVAKSLGLARGSIGFIRGRCLTRLQRTLEELGF